MLCSFLTTLPLLHLNVYVCEEMMGRVCVLPFAFVGLIETETPGPVSVQAVISESSQLIVQRENLFTNRGDTESLMFGTGQEESAGETTGHEPSQR